MYIFPGYVNWHEKEGVITIESELKQTTVELIDNDIKDEFYAIIRNGGAPAIFSQLTVFLHENNLLLSREEIDGELEPIYKMLDDSLLITIMPTEDCNFRCTYCYENHIPITMSKNTISQIGNFYPHRSRTINSFLSTGSEENRLFV